MVPSADGFYDGQVGSGLSNLVIKKERWFSQEHAAWLK
jgi:hypothetical protein